MKGQFNQPCRISISLLHQALVDLDRYEHLREVWYGHAVRQQVVAERGSSRQVILPDFY